MDSIHQRYRVLRQSLPAGLPITMLHIGARHSAIAVGTGAEHERVITLAIGSEITASEFFRHTPPAPGEIENAIQQVEDELTRARPMIAGYPALYTTDVAIHDIAHSAGIKPGMQVEIPVESVEQVFSLLATRALGRPAASTGIPDSAGFAATLLILREFMHHLGFHTINLIRG